MIEKYGAGPHCNTGVELPHDSPLIACVDWVSVTFTTATELASVLDLISMKLSDFEHFDYGRFSYKESLKSTRGINIFYTDESVNNDGIFLEISGQGCRFLEENWKNDFSWVEFFNILKIYGYRNITRLDIAFDDFKGYLSIPTMYKKVRQGCLTSTAGLRTWKHFESGDIEKGEVLGETLYFGSSSGEIMFRFYDKKGERNAKGFVFDDEFDLWNRYEVQTRGERSGNLVDIIASGGLSIGECVKGIMSHYLTFRVENKNTDRKDRWKICRWWETFLNGVSPLKLTKIHPERSFYKSRDWLIKQGAPTIAMILEAYDYDLSILESIASIGRNNMKKHHDEMIFDFKRDLDMKILRKEEFYSSLSDIYTKKGTATLENDNSAN